VGISSLRVTEYFTTCDFCGCAETLHSEIANVYTKQQAIKSSGMHKIKDGRILCNECFNKYKNKEIE